MIKDYTDNIQGIPLLPLHVLLFLISSKVSFIYTIPDTAFVTLVVEHWLEQEIDQSKRCFTIEEWGLLYCEDYTIDI